MGGGQRNAGIGEESAWVERGRINAAERLKVKLTLAPLTMEDQP
jgi:hypothetical protein